MAQRPPNEKKCGLCYKPNCTLRCSNCHVQYYCCKDHQIIHWKFKPDSHRKMCPIMKANPAAISSQEQFKQNMGEMSNNEYFDALEKALSKHSKSLNKYLKRVLLKTQPDFAENVESKIIKLIATMAAGFIISCDDCGAEFLVSESLKSPNLLQQLYDLYRFEWNSVGLDANICRNCTKNMYYCKGCEDFFREAKSCHFIFNRDGRNIGFCLNCYIEFCGQTYSDEYPYCEKCRHFDYALLPDTRVATCKNCNKHICLRCLKSSHNKCPKCGHLKQGKPLVF